MEVILNLVIIGYVGVQTLLLLGIYKAVITPSDAPVVKKSILPKRKPKLTEQDLKFKKEMEKMVKLRANIDVFDGTSVGQQEIK